MTTQHGCDNMQPQFLTREKLFFSKAAQIHVFDGITHSISAKLLNTASPLPLRNYFKVPVLFVDDVANYYCVDATTIKGILAFNENRRRDLISDGMLILRGNDIEGAHQQLDTPLQLKKLVLLPPRAVLKLCLFLPGTSVVTATVDALWDYVLEHGLNDSTPSNWRKTLELENVRAGHGISRAPLLVKQKQFKSLGLYPYVQHFGYQNCKETWNSLEEHNKTRKDEFPPPRGNVFWIV